MMKLPRNLFMITVLLAFMFSVPAVSAKHIIVIYDVSGSMLRHHNRTYMRSEDISRLNTYLTRLIFTDMSHPLLDNNKDKLIKECDSTYASRSLYQAGDVLTYAEYAEERREKISRSPVNANEFQEQLPDPTNLKRSFYGMVSYLLRAEVEVYDELFKAADDETYWVFVTDGDIDRSEKSDSEIRQILQRHAQIEEEFHNPLICSILFNDRVKIEVRRIQKRVVIDTIFVANHAHAKTELQGIQFGKDNTGQLNDIGQFTSETLIINTASSEKTAFTLGSVTVKVANKNGRPLQIAGEDNSTKPLQIAPISLQGKSPPAMFHISLPAYPELTSPENLLSLEVSYNYNGVDRVHQGLPVSYTAAIKSLYASEGTLPGPSPEDASTSLGERGWRGEELELQLSDDSYLGEIVIQSESQNKGAFRIEEIVCYVEDKAGQELCDASVSNSPETLGETFQIVVPKHERLDWFGNRLILDIKYRYAEDPEPEDEGISIPFKLRSNSGFPTWLLIILLCVAVILLLFLGFRWMRGLITPDPVEIRLAEVGGDDIGRSFTLTHKTHLEFGPGDNETLRFDVGSSALLRCRHGRILLYENASVEKGEELSSSQTLTVRRDSNDEQISISFEIVGDEQQETSEDDISEGGKEGEEAPPPY